MFIPIRTDRPPRRTPIVTEGLIALNLLVYLTGLVGQAFGAFDLRTMTQWMWFHPQDFRVWQLFTSMFMHDPGQIGHLAFNMLFLWVFGAPVEDRLGRLGFLAFYLMAGVFAALAHMMVSQSPVIGASGAIAGLTGAFLALCPRSRILVLFLLGFVVYAVPSLWFIGLYFAIDVLRQAGELLGRGGARVAYMAHIAGYIYGFVLAFALLGLGVIKRTEFDMFFLFKQWRRRAAFRQASGGGPAGLWDSSTADTTHRLATFKKEEPELTEADREHLELRSEINRLANEHDLPAAAAAYRRLLARAPNTVFAESRQLELANQLYAQAEYEWAAKAYELLLERYPGSSHGAEVRLILGVIYTRQLKHPARAREVIEAAKPRLQSEGQQALAEQLLTELPT